MTEIELTAEERLERRLEQIRQRVRSASNSRVHEYPAAKLRQRLDDARYLLWVLDTGKETVLAVESANERANQLTRDLNDMGAPLE